MRAACLWSRDSRSPYHGRTTRRRCTTESRRTSATSAPTQAEGTCIFASRQVVPATTTFVDIAGLVRGASKGEGLGNAFLSHVREVDAIAMVVRCFEDANVVHVDAQPEPLRDIETINVELALADLAS